MSKSKAINTMGLRTTVQSPKIPLFIRITQWLTISSALLSFSLLGYYVRLYPVFLYGFYINEFDPYIRYFMTEQILKYGALKGLLWWLHKGYGAHFTDFWYPWGINWTVVLSPGVSWLGAVLYKVLAHFGYSLLQTVVLFPAILNAMVVPAMFYLGYRLGGKYVGLTAALWSVFSTMILQRATAGWFADAPVFQLMATLGLAFYVETLTRNDRYWLIFAILSALFNGMTVWLWGSYVFLWNFYGLFTIAVLLYILIRMAMRQNPLINVDRVVFSYILTDLGFNTFVVITPRYSIYTLLSGLSAVANATLLFALISYLLIKLYQNPKYQRTMSMMIKYFLVVLVVLIAVFIISGLMGIGGKFLGALSPLARSAIVQSVAEHSPSSLQQSFFNVSITLPFVIYTILLSVFTLSLPALLISIGSLAAAYFASSEVWLFMILGLFWIPATAYGFIKLSELSLGRKSLVGLVVMTVLGVLMAISLIINLQPALSTAILPQQIVSTVTPPYPTPDWLDALRWISYNTPPNATILSWWDYGYWTAVIGNRTSLADNSTVNSTQIALIGLFFMSNPYNYTGVLDILNELHDPQYILIFEPYIVVPTNRSICVLIPEYPAGGDFAKSYWMARIAGYSVPYIETHYIGIGQLTTQSGILSIYVPYANDATGYYAAVNTTLYLLMFNSEVVDSSYAVWSMCARNGIPAYWVFESIPMVVSSGTTFKVITEPLSGYQGPSTPYYYLLSPPPWAQLVYVSRPYGWVIIYKINYDVLRSLAGSVSQ
ncbi:STT3 domain-containing protein [Vulcanisaeta thermophila]|uniref:STT3 domain-containing protein n=1 Tax=Vulcanisaeta thermophila TaxID=867917 RepID=UPI000852C1B8|nr:STT3 domain-containing protein [Vulcanisaeta thermophila]